MAKTVTLEFLGRQFERLFAELAEMRSEQVSVREDMHVLTAIVLRHDATLNGILDQLHAMTAQLNRLDIRLRRFEEQQAPT
jgi:hydrogenase maturation factor